MMKKGLSSVTLWIVIFLVFILLFMKYNQQDRPQPLGIMAWEQIAQKGYNQSKPEEPNSLIIEAVDEDGLIKSQILNEEANEVQSYVTEYLSGSQGELVLKWAKQYNVKYRANPGNPLIGQLLFSIALPILVILILWMLLMRQIQGGGNKAMSFGKSKARLVKEGEIKISFKDVAGVEEAREELEEVVDYLKDPKKFSRLGARIPKGVLLIGPPGTGKTLLARAIAGEAGVPFFSISGSDFVEMFVGVGASRVRDLFEQAKKAKPCIIFIDEIDAVGRSRFAGIGGGHDEREQTLNQLLVEMDGFAENEGVILVAATNRPDVLDQALLRPGRFDRQVVVDLPDIKGREMILGVHAKKVKMKTGVSLSRIAKGTPGFSGADLANLINEAALLGARRNKEAIDYEEFEEAKDRVMMGPERKSMVISEKEKLVTAYHEAGHALVAHFTPSTDPVHKITIVPRGRALGLTWILPTEDRHTLSRQHLVGQLYHLMGGRSAEIIQFGEYTTGASNDIERATNLAHRMVCQFGMSERLGPRTFGEQSNMVFLGKEMGRNRNYSEETATLIDEEVKKLIDDANEFALNMLHEKREVLERVAEALMERETLDENEFKLLIEDKELPPMEKYEPPPEPPAAEEKNTEETTKPKPAPPTLSGPETQPSV